VRREAEGVGEQEETGRGAYHSARSNTMRTIVPTFAIHSNSWRGDMQRVGGCTSHGGDTRVQLYIGR